MGKKSELPRGLQIDTTTGEGANIFDSMKDIKDPKKQDMDPEKYKDKLKPKKANLGLMFMKEAKKKGAKGAEFLSPLAMSRRFFDDGGEVEIVKGGDYIKDLID